MRWTSVPINLNFGEEALRFLTERESEERRPGSGGKLYQRGEGCGSPFQTPPGFLIPAASQGWPVRREG